MKNKKYKIFAAIIVLFCISFFVLQYINRPFTEYKTEFAENYTVSDEIPIKGVSIKNETVLKKSTSGTVCYVVADGSKVAKGQLIGYIYPDDSQAILKQKSLKKEESIKTLSQIKNTAGNLSSNYEMLTKQINQNINDINMLSTKGFYSNFETIKNQYVLNSARREQAIDNTVNIDSAISALDDEKKQIEKKISAKPKSIYSPISGYFISKVNGFESETLKNNKDIASSDIDSFFATSQANDDYVGKFAGDYKWNFIGYIDAKHSEKLMPGQNITAKFSFISSSEVPVTVESAIVDSKDSNKLIVSLSCEYMTSEIAAIHCQNAQIILKTYSGLKISKKSMRFQNDIPGVYVKNNNKMNFKALDILFENDSIIISKYNDNDDSLLKIYDEVISEGPDLYNDKPL